MSYFSFKLAGLSYTFRILLGCIIVWVTLSYFQDARKIWALISVIVVSEPDYQAIRNASITRVLNTIVGCSIGLLLVWAFEVHVWSLMAGIAIAVLVGTTFNKYPSSWKLAPVTVIIVMMPSLTENAALKDAMTVALSRTAEVLFGCLVAFMLSLIFREIEKMLSKEKDVVEQKASSTDTSDMHE